MGLTKYITEKLLDRADIQINGNRPWDITTSDENEFYRRVGREGRLGLAESYMDGVWSTDGLDELIYRGFVSGVSTKLKSMLTPLNNLAHSLINFQTKQKSKRVAEVHYDLGNEFYRDMLGETMQYTCAYFKDAHDLDTAQRQKLDLVCQKLELERSDKVLELGGGWGGFANFAATEFGSHVTSYNISEEQVKYARQWNSDLSVEIVHSDYRDATRDFNIEFFDKVASVGLCEHVGHKNYRTLMETAHKPLKDHGLFLLHTIGRDTSVKSTEDPFIAKYIFPGGMIPSLRQISTAAEGLFTVEDVHNIGSYYDPTLMGWFKNFDETWEKHKDEFDDHDRFYKMWEYYLKSCAGAFRARKLQLFQVVLSKNGVPGGYTSIR